VRRLFSSFLYPAFFQNIKRLIQKSKGNERVCKICPILEAIFFVAKERTYLRTQYFFLESSKPGSHYGHTILLSEEVSYGERRIQTD
jgi:hypothetical protein